MVEKTGGRTEGRAALIIYKKQDYIHLSDIDPEVVGICDALNCMPGVKTISSCCGHGRQGMSISLELTDPMGIFFLARCKSHRYWKYGSYWCLNIYAADRKTEENPYPAYFNLESGHVGEEAYQEASDFIRNVIVHLNHKTFLDGYKIDLSRFDVEGEELGEDWWEVIRSYNAKN